MPLWDFKCNECETVVELFGNSKELPSSDSSEVPCTHCGSGLLYKMLSAPQMIHIGGASSSPKPRTEVRSKRVGRLVNGVLTDDQ